MKRRCVAAFLLLLSGCASYDPPMAGDHTVTRYQVDLQRCQKQARSDAARKANATPQSAVAAVFSSDEPERQEIRSCMQSRGYHLAS